MHIEKHTCPFTGAEFQAVHMADSWIVTHPLLNGDAMYPIEGDCLMVPIYDLQHFKTMTPAEAAEMLGVSRQRVDQLASAGKLCQRYVNGSPVFLEADVLKYKDSRKNGRPRKE